MREIDYAKGSIIGAFVGDALGAFLEFRGETTKELVAEALEMKGGGRLNIGAGQFTDDSEMAMCQLNALKSLNPTHGMPIDDVLKWYRKWANENPIDIGITTSNALWLDTDLPSQQHINRVSQENANSKSNGSMMRMTPLCVWTRNLPITKRVEYYRLDSQLTHPNPTVLDACSGYGLAISNLIKSGGDIKQTLSVLEDWLLNNANQEVNEWYEESNMDNLENFTVTRQKGFVRWGFILAFYFLKNELDYRTAIEQTLLLGGDTDTNAAIVGGIIGTYAGIKQIPSNFVDKMINYKFKEGISQGYERPGYLSPQNLLAWIEELFRNSI